MHITRKADYALRAVVYLANQVGDKRSSISEIAEAEGIPRDFLAKILRDLTTNGFVKSFHGVKGGYTLARAKSEVNFLTIIEAMEGPVKLSLSLDEKNSEMRTFWANLQKVVMKALKEMTLNNPQLSRKK